MIELISRVIFSYDIMNNRDLHELGYTKSTEFFGENQVSYVKNISQCKSFSTSLLSTYHHYNMQCIICSNVMFSQNLLSRVDIDIFKLNILKNSYMYYDIFVRYRHNVRL